MTGSLKHQVQCSTHPFQLTNAMIKKSESLYLLDCEVHVHSQPPFFLLLQADPLTMALSTFPRSVRQVASTVEKIQHCQILYFPTPSWAGLDKSPLL